MLLKAGSDRTSRDTLCILESRALHTVTKVCDTKAPSRNSLDLLEIGEEERNWSVFWLNKGLSVLGCRGVRET